MPARAQLEMIPGFLIKIFERSREGREGGEGKAFPLRFSSRSSRDTPVPTSANCPLTTDD